VVAPFLKYYFFTFLKKGRLIIQQGVLNRRKAIPLERILTVNICQNLIQQVLQLVAVDVETAGSKTKRIRNSRPGQ
jgi:putative membrane protein